jgi:hypothetical protein
MESAGGIHCPAILVFGKKAKKNAMKVSSHGNVFIFGACGPLGM